MLKRVVFAVLVSLAAAPAYAQEGFKRFDLDQNGRIERAEFYGFASEAGVYDEWDSDGDGFIERAEFTEVGFPERAGGFDELDIDNNAYLDATEIYNGVFRAYDVDESGHWDAGEWDDAGDAGFFDI